MSFINIDYNSINVIINNYIYILYMSLVSIITVIVIMIIQTNEVTFITAGI